MNKKILLFAIASTLLQVCRLILVFKNINASWLTEIIIIFSLIAIPITFYLTFKNIKLVSLKDNILNWLGVFFTFPLIFISIFTYKVLSNKYSETPVEISPSSISVSEENGNKLPIDSFSVIIEKDSNNNDIIKFKKKKQ